MIALYARLEPTTDEVLLRQHPRSKRRDTVIYNDPKRTEVKARIPWHHKNRPVSRNYVTLNCYRYHLIWE